MESVANLEGRIGLPAPVRELAARRWDVVVVGGGHNGLTAAAYLARAGLSVLVLERRDHLGGACTLERPFPDERFAVSPCAYLVGLLHPLVVEELGLRDRGYRVQQVDPHLWCPFEDGTSLTLWDDSDASAAAIARLAPGDVHGYRAYEALFARIRRALRPAGDWRHDTWLGPRPTTRAEVTERLALDPEAQWVVFEASIAEVIERYVRDERIRTALHGQGCIGTFAGPRDPGTAWVHTHHTLGTLEGVEGAWGFAEGGVGRVSFALADAARDAGATLACGVEVARIEIGVGVRLAGGELVECGKVVANADPKRVLALLPEGPGDGVPAAFRAKVEAWRAISPVVKLNCALSRLPTFTAAGPADRPERAMVTIATSTDATQAACEAARRGEAAPAWCELYFQTAYDPTVAAPGAHTMSVFAQFVPYQLAQGTWDERREEIGDAVLAAIARHAPDVADCVLHRQVLGPPDVEAGVGLSGGHIFQGECLPDQMWDARFAPRTGVPGLYLCGAATHPGGSIMAVNGRNAAMAVLADSGKGLS